MKSSNPEFHLPADVSDEEKLIDRIISSIESPEALSNSELTNRIKADLLNLKKSVSESDFTVRYLNMRAKALQQFIDQFPSMLGYWNKDLINVHSNEAYANYFGKAPEEVRGKSIADLLGEKIFKLKKPFIDGVLAGSTQTFEREIPTPNGMVSTLASYIPHFAEDQVIGFFVVVTDISEKKELEERTKRLENTLYEQSRLSSLGQMATSIAHEINNPVAIIFSNACLLLKELRKQKLDKDFFRERLSEIERTSERIEKIVDGLQSVARGGVNIEVQKNEIADIIDQVISICRARFQKSGVGILWQRPTESHYALCNSVQISEILLNILNNAFDAVNGRPDPKVVISVSKTESQVRVGISNNGPTIPVEEREKLFLPFFSTKGNLGTGLGLKISRDLAVANEGELQISESPTTEFELFLKKA